MGITKNPDQHCAWCDLKELCDVDENGGDTEQFIKDVFQGRRSICGSPRKRAKFETYSIMNKQAIHDRIRKYRGKAAGYKCVDDCGEWAFDWSHIAGTDPNNFDNYEPRCRSCHKKYDMTDVTRTRIGLAMQGVKNPNAKLDDVEIKVIRELYATGEYTQRNIADAYGISQRLVWNIICGKAWRHVS